MKRITASLKSDRPILREVLYYLVTNAGMEVVGQSSDSLDLLCSIDRLRPEVVFLWADGLKEPGIVSHLLQEFPHLKVVVVSRESFHDLGRGRPQAAVFRPLHGIDSRFGCGKFHALSS